MVNVMLNVLVNWNAPSLCSSCDPSVGSVALGSEHLPEKKRKGKRVESKSVHI